MRLRISCVIVGILSLALSLVQLTFAQTLTKTTSALPQPARGMAEGQAESALPASATDVTTTGGTADHLPIFNGTSTVIDSIVSQSGTTLDVTGAVTMPATNSTGTEGVLAIGNMLLHNYGPTGSDNAFLGYKAGNFKTTGSYDTGIGYAALDANTSGSDNTAVGAYTLGANTTGKLDSAFGFGALNANTTGYNNSAFGYEALVSNTTGYNNSAFGYAALVSNTTGNQNQAFGLTALGNNTTGLGNSAFGTGALLANTTGGSGSSTGGNSAFGNFALSDNTTAGSNSAFGFAALEKSTTGNYNVAVGSSALTALKTGSNNIAVGNGAGGNLDGAESNDIYIGNSGEAGESNTIRIGYIGTVTAAAIAGIWGRTSASGVEVLVNATGLLGTTTSSRQFKHQIADMGEESDVLMKLRPVSFYYKPELDETQTRQYGLVAEEVAQLAPQLVVFDKDGAPQTVRYRFVNAMLLNEVQKQRRLVEDQQKTTEEQNNLIARQRKELQDLAARVLKLEMLLSAKR